MAGFVGECVNVRDVEDVATLLDERGDRDEGGFVTGDGCATSTVAILTMAMALTGHFVVGRQ